MRFTALEQKILLLAMDPAAPPGELASAANKLVLLLRKRFQDGYALIGDLETLPERDAVNRFGEYVIRFGKHKGKPLKEIPVDYLSYLLTIDLHDGTRAAIKGWLRPA
jgi:hypothetical protein